ncbi:MAG: hypothetical protein HFJ89_10850 [Oscillospiraceae bacterium]|jgi:hypothetical protein|nr:hypothetical protein [Oscillospiraceae bacterium]
MKMTKRFMTMAVCSVMAAASLVGISASATEVNCCSNSTVNVYNGSAELLAVFNKHTISSLGTTFKQDGEHLCWAACTQAVLKYYGVTKTQKDISFYIHNDENNYDKSGDVYDIGNALNHFNKDSKKSFVGDGGKMATCDKIIKKVNNDKPVIMVGKQTVDVITKGHAILCYGYDKTNNSNIKLYVICPNENGGRKITFTCDSVDSTSFTSSDGTET